MNPNLSNFFKLQTFVVLLDSTENVASCVHIFYKGETHFLQKIFKVGEGFLPTTNNQVTRSIKEETQLKVADFELFCLKVSSFAQSRSTSAPLDI